MACEHVKVCPCTNRDCEYNRHCCKCVAYHRDRGDLPICLRNLKKKEKE